jgi:HK97 family phage prohead protease
MSLLSLQKKITGIGKRVYFQPSDYDRLAKAFGVSPEEVAKLAPQMPIGSPTLELDDVRKNSTGDGRIYTFIASDQSVDRSGDTIDPHGWDLAGWKKTGSPILYGHDASSLPIGKGVAARVDKDRLMVSVRFAPTSMGQRVEQLIAGDHGLKSVSVGFVPTTFSFSKDKDRLHGIDYHSQKLLELSVVSVPANENAVLQRALTPAERKDEAQALLARIKAEDAMAKREEELEARMASTTPAQRRRERQLDVIRIRGRS